MYEHLLGRILKVGETRVWRTYKGGRRLDLWRGRDKASDGNFPEDWIASTVQANQSGSEAVLEGLSRISADAACPTLKEVLEEAPTHFLGEAHVAAFGSAVGMLIKLIDAAERLAIQVHPDKAYAKTFLHSDYGKTESWYILGGEAVKGEEPCVYLGFKPGVTPGLWRDVFERQDIPAMLDCLHRIPVREGDVFLIEGGVPHAIGAGCFLAELQEPTDYTMRTERKTASGRPINDFLCHQGVGFDKMLDCFHYQAFTREETLSRWRIQPMTLAAGEWGVCTSLIDERATSLFKMRKISIVGRYLLKREPVFSVVIVVSGAGRIVTSLETVEIGQGDFLFIPASVAEGEVICAEPALELIECFPPRPH